MIPLISPNCTSFSLSLVVQQNIWALLYWNMVSIFYTVLKVHQVNFLLEQETSIEDGR